MTWLKEQLTRFKRWFIPKFVCYYLDGVLLRFVLFTCRVEIRGLEKFMLNALLGPTVAVAWHNRIPLFSYALRKTVLNTLPVTALISKSGDADMLGAIIQRQKNVQFIRVAHDARLKALREITRTVKTEKRLLLVTPDGPRGPRYQCKPGALMAAEMTGAKVMAVTWSASRFFQLGSWDKMLIPLPFSKVIISLSEPLDVGTEGTLEERTAKLDELLREHDRAICSAISPNPAHWPK